MNTKLSFFIGMMIFMFIMFNYSNTIAHETAHQKIDEYMGAENITTTYNILGLLGAYTVADYTPKMDIKTVEALHAINEMVGYQYNSLFLGFFILFIFLGVILFSRSKCPNCGSNV